MVLASEYEDGAYARTNHTIIEEAIALGNHLEDSVSALLVWEGKARGAGDLTEEFGLYAKKKGVPLLDDVLTV
jgi:hypothetical protein